jgi:hypothetical protein
MKWMRLAVPLLLVVPVLFAPVEYSAASGGFAVATACASHGNCCGGDGVCELEQGVYVFGKEHPSWCERLFGCGACGGGIE